ncbi:MAG TPA: hypothetical protein DDX91_08460 [Ruminococcaceae bacterium]|nr:hypothetical protein [Oscillospiraceae bacterium]
MRSVTPMRAAKAGYITISAVYCILGLTLIIHPSFSAQVVAILCGAALIIFGIVKIAGYFSKDLFRLAYQFDLATGILLILLGIVVMIKPDDFLNLLCVVLGITVLIEGLFKVQVAMDSKSFGIKRWWLIMAAAVLSGIHGLLLVFRPDTGMSFLLVLLGLSLLCSGVLNLITVLTAVKIVNNQQPDSKEDVSCRFSTEKTNK